MVRPSKASIRVRLIRASGCIFEGVLEIRKLGEDFRVHPMPDIHLHRSGAGVELDARDDHGIRSRMMIDGLREVSGDGDGNLPKVSCILRSVASMNDYILCTPIDSIVVPFWGFSQVCVQDPRR